MTQAALRIGKQIADRRLDTGGRFASTRGRRVFLMLFGALQKWLGLNRAGRMFCGRAPISPGVLRFFRAIGLKIYRISV